MQSSAIVKCRHIEIMGEVEDLSLNGVRLKTSERLDPSKEVENKLFFRSDCSELWVEIPGVVIRHESNGMVIQFTRMSLDSYVHLRNVISHLLGDERKISDELFSYMTRRSAKGPCAKEEFEELFEVQVEQQFTPQ
jgi:hypothetical protein